MEQINKTNKQIKLEQMLEKFHLKWGEIETHYWVHGFQSLEQLNSFRDEMDTNGIRGKEHSSDWWRGMDEFLYAENDFLDALAFEFPKRWLE